MNLPDQITDVDELEDLLSRPTETAINKLSQLPGDILILGVAGKMGPTLARMARRAAESDGSDRTIWGVSRFTDPSIREKLEAWGIRTIAGDLLGSQFVDNLPDVPNVISMVGFKFGAAQNPEQAWAVNAYVPALICNRFRQSRLVAFSTGNVYGTVDADGQGSREQDPPDPVGEYAMSCLGRERIYEFFSRQLQIPTTILRLNYAHELRYGVLVDLALKIQAQIPIELSMGYVNIIWQADANAMTLAALSDTEAPGHILNIAGPERLSVRDVCTQLGELLDESPQLRGQEAPDAFLSNSQLATSRYGPPHVDADQLFRWVADWIRRKMPVLNKPTKFEVRHGGF